MFTSLPAFIFFLLVSALCGVARAETPLPMGDLHGAVLREWRQASDGNQFATASDLVERILNMHDPIALRPKARQVQACINRVAGNFQQGSQSVADTAVACMAELGMLGRPPV